MFVAFAISVFIVVVGALLVYRGVSSVISRMKGVINDLESKLRYRQNEVDALSKFNDELLEVLRNERRKNSVLMEECKSFAASVVYWKRQSEKAVLDDE